MSSRGAADDQALAVADLLGQAGRRLRRAAQAQLEPYGMTWGKLRVLRHVAEAAATSGPIRMSELARAADMVPRSATTVVDELEVAGLVRRRPDRTDRRAVLVELTPTGARALADLRAARAVAARQLLDRLGEREQAQLRRLLERVVTDPEGS